MGVLPFRSRPYAPNRAIISTRAVVTFALLLLLLLLLLLRYHQHPEADASPTPYTKALVVASTSATAPNATAWLPDVPPGWAVYHYITDDAAPAPPALPVPADRGNEAMAYLTYIIDGYAALPDVVYFHHGHYRSWHQALDSVSEVRGLRAEHVVERGYVSPRCVAGCENVMPVSSDAVGLGNLHLVARDVRLRTFLGEFLDAGEEIPEKIAAPCCAQFVVSRDAIRSRSLGWWRGMRNWLMNTSLSSYDSGRLLEWTWHIWFGEAPQL
ncbi:hypothetical protein BKA67DRAFT_660741 [Truncatella angustata]|uniref:Uncharacterized protein n=1 Tax=Truncatella angustata TaxID=152316 RepID=A0A9P8UGM4_9PEZI|nr:uncharacterized protein BKA67DRAFT_660741 [Truncatella angustata]KAH6651967.1 hypothetical protein BKA67DRAFT_660741 [Truncatella angustata]